MLRKSDLFFFIAIIMSFAVSVYLWFTGNKEAGLYTGLWVPSLISLAIYVNIILGRNRDG